MMCMQSSDAQSLRPSAVLAVDQAGQCTLHVPAAVQVAGQRHPGRLRRMMMSMLICCPVLSHMTPASGQVLECNIAAACCVDPDAQLQFSYFGHIDTRLNAAERHCQPGESWLAPVLVSAAPCWPGALLCLSCHARCCIVSRHLLSPADIMPVRRWQLWTLAAWPAPYGTERAGTRARLSSRSLAPCMPLCTTGPPRCCTPAVATFCATEAGPRAQLLPLHCSPAPPRVSGCGHRCSPSGQKSACCPAR